MTIYQFSLGTFVKLLRGDKTACSKHPTGSLMVTQSVFSDLRI